MIVRWLRLEQYINTLDDREPFTSVAYADWANIGRSEASEHIQAYLEAQRGVHSHTKYVIKRLPGTRTSSAQWIAGERARDVRTLGLTLSSDTRVKMLRALKPDLQRIAEINPAAAHRAEIVAEATIDGAMKVLEAAVRA